MLKITVEGVYESDIGSGQKKYENFNYTFEKMETSKHALHKAILETKRVIGGKK